MQLELLRQEDKPGWKVVKVKEQRFGKSKWPIYVHTVPDKWRGPESSEKLPWEQ